jgi:hypothetical protein
MANYVYRPTSEMIGRGVVFDSKDLRRRQLGLDRYPTVSMMDVGAIGLLGLAFCALWVWCRLTGQKPDQFL